jgi:micrococcal nuclease
MNPLARALPVLLLAALLADPAAAKSLQGVVNQVTDGDTLWIRPADGPPVQVRIHGLDAPEICQAFGREARDALAARVLHRKVRVAARAQDAYQRTVGNVSLKGEDVGAWLVAHGYAWSARNRGGGPYAREEAQARQAKLGLWAANPVEPRSFRRRHGSCHAA